MAGKMSAGSGEEGEMRRLRWTRVQLAWGMNCLAPGAQGDGVGAMVASPEQQNASGSGSVERGREHFLEKLTGGEGDKVEEA